jgi:hypothetical protein
MVSAGAFVDSRQGARPPARVDNAEAKALLADVLTEWRGRTYAALTERVDGEPATGEVVGASGTRYGFEIEVVWDRRPGGDVRVLAMIDDGGLRALWPLTDGFILAPDGRFVDEDSE